MRLLIVDDERELATTLRQGFEHQGFAVDAVFDGETGLRLASLHDYDVIVLDRLLPKLDGLMVCRHLRRLGRPVGIVMLTAKDAVDDRVEGLNAGADDYLVKPFEFKELLARVRAVTRRHGPERTNILTARQVTVDLDAGQVQCNGLPVSLSRKEYVLLVFMLRHPGQLLTYERMRAHAWDAGAAPSIEGVRAHVKNLRKKIDEGVDHKLIKTIHGMGYRLEP